MDNVIDGYILTTQQQHTGLHEYKLFCEQMDDIGFPHPEFWGWYEAWAYENGLAGDLHCRLEAWI